MILAVDQVGTIHLGLRPGVGFSGSIIGAGSIIDAS